MALINSKFALNCVSFQGLLDAAAALGVFLNYDDKLELRTLLDHNDRQRLAAWIDYHRLNAELKHLFVPIDTEKTRRLIAHNLQDPQISRTDARQCDKAELRESILRSLFGGFIFSSFLRSSIHEHLNADCRIEYLPDFFDHLKRFHPSVLNRECALTFLTVNDRARELLGPRLRDTLFNFVERAYDRLSNHCYLAVLLSPFREGDEDGQWRLYSDLVLFAEKHRDTRLDARYFRPDRIASATREHVPLMLNQGHFEIANEGFVFKDCMVVHHDEPLQDAGGSSRELLLLFEKNHRDETLVPCPACRSRNVRSNSYPVLGVKSWECQYPLCPARSAFDRGNRYCVAALIKQRAISSQDDQIPIESLRRWKLDIVHNADENEIAEMLIRHYSLYGDHLLFVNTDSFGSERYGRRISYAELPATPDIPQRYVRFQQSNLFSRFLVDRPSSVNSGVSNLASGDDDVTVYQGHAFDAIRGLRTESVDGAVTSPPYYNARSYSEWPNIYCYLYDMYCIARETFRVLRPGAYYLFNIFDYFDNENSIVLSAMGKKRMILGAYIINAFRRIGFQLDGNTVWFKGEIEGKRNFNRGNRSPYYQLPLNCWEHIFGFRKPGASKPRLTFPSILSVRPVIKMVRGENRLGHSAPFPDAIPNLLVSQLPSGGCVLDPFAGSMTTARAAKRFGVRSISIELHREYCDLGIKLLHDRDAAAMSPFTSPR